jgi:hypothetical protein
MKGYIEAEEFAVTIVEFLDENSLEDSSAPYFRQRSNKSQVLIFNTFLEAVCSVEPVLKQIAEEVSEDGIPPLHETDVQAHETASVPTFVVPTEPDGEIHV